METKPRRPGNPETETPRGETPVQEPVPLDAYFYPFRSLRARLMYSPPPSPPPPCKICGGALRGDSVYCDDCQRLVPILARMPMPRLGERTDHVLEGVLSREEIKLLLDLVEAGAQDKNSPGPATQPRQWYGPDGDPGGDEADLPDDVTDFEEVDLEDLLSVAIFAGKTMADYGLLTKPVNRIYAWCKQCYASWKKAAARLTGADRRAAERGLLAARERIMTNILDAVIESVWAAEREYRSQHVKYPPTEWSDQRKEWALRMASLFNAVESVARQLEDSTSQEYSDRRAWEVAFSKLRANAGGPGHRL